MDTIYKICAHCHEQKPIQEFLRRTGKRSGKASRRGSCRSCRKQRKADQVTDGSDAQGAAEQPRVMQASPQLLLDEGPPLTPKIRTRRPLPPPPPRPEGPDASILRPTREGFIRMRGRTDKGRRWYQETDLETAVILVKEHAAVVVNRHTIRRIYTNKSFRRFILARDRHQCFFCGEYGDTIDHLLPRSKGGHTTPMNCVCACSICNQSKASHSLDDFLGQGEQ